MNNALLDELPPATREMIESAGYRVARWSAAREVLQNRVMKGRIVGDLGEFLTHWLAVGAVPADVNVIKLTFSITPEDVWLVGDSTALADAPLERALLHLPALRRFWAQELRLQHFTALRASVPAAWLLDDASVPPGAVIHGLGITAWDQLGELRDRKLAVWSELGTVDLVLPKTLLGRNKILTAMPASGERLNADYQRDDKGRIVLRSIAAAP